MAAMNFTVVSSSPADSPCAGTSSAGYEPVAEIDALVGQRQRQGRRRPHVAARVQHHAAEERRHQRGRDMARGSKSGDRQGESGHARAPISAVAPSWASMTLRSNEEVCAFT
jgi:hypothetical protein